MHAQKSLGTTAWFEPLLHIVFQSTKAAQAKGSSRFRCKMFLHVSTENKNPQQKVCMVKSTNQPPCTRQQANKYQDLHATCSKTQQGFSYKICVLPQNKDFMFYFPIQENGHFSSSPPLFSFYHYSELFSCEGIGKH